MTIAERIKKVRQEKHLTQQGFADKIGISRNNVATYEVGKSNPGEAVISLICREFHVNETWLRTGEGEMFTDEDAAILSQLAAEYRLTENQLSLIRNFLTLPDKYRAAVVHIAKQLANGEPSPAEPTFTEKELAAYEKVKAMKEKGRPPEETEAAALHAELDRQLAEEKRDAAVSSSGSSDTAALIGRKILAASPGAQAAVSRIIEEDEGA